jgi:hypothetical protein
MKSWVRYLELKNLETNEVIALEAMMGDFSADDFTAYDAGIMGTPDEFLEARKNLYKKVEKLMAENNIKTYKQKAKELEQLDEFGIKEIDRLLGELGQAEFIEHPKEKEKKLKKSGLHVVFVSGWDFDAFVPYYFAKADSEEEVVKNQEG